MNTDNRIKDFCSICKHRTLDPQKGLVCGRNNKKPDFSDSCSHIEFDKAEYEKSVRKQYENGTAEKDGYIPKTKWEFWLQWGGTICLTLLGATYGIYMLISVIGIENPIMIWVNVSAIILIPILVGGYYFYLRLKKKPLNALSKKDIQEIIKIEGYYPYKEDDQICFKSDGNTYEIIYDAPKFILLHRYGFEGDYNTALYAASTVMNKRLLGKIHIDKLPDRLGITVYVDALIHYTEELKISFPYYFHLINEVADCFLDEYQQLANGKQAQDESENVQNILVN